MSDEIGRDEGYRGHRNWDLRTDSCTDCGASRAEIDDNLVKACVPTPAGPTREAIIALRVQLRVREDEINGIRRFLHQAEDSIPGFVRAIREAEAKVAELRSSIAILEKANAG